MTLLRQGRVPITVLTAATVAATGLAFGATSPAQAAVSGYSCTDFAAGDLVSYGSHTLSGQTVCVVGSNGASGLTGSWSVPAGVASFDVLAVGAGGGGGGRGPLETYLLNGTTVKGAAGGGGGGGGQIRLLPGATGSTVTVSVGSGGLLGPVETAGSAGGDTSVSIDSSTVVTAKGGPGGATGGSGSGGTGSGGAGGSGATGGLGGTVLDAGGSGGTGGGYSGVFGLAAGNGLGGIEFGADSNYELFQDSWLTPGGGGGGGGGIANSNGGARGLGTYDNGPAYTSGGNGARAISPSSPGFDTQLGYAGGGGGGGAYKGYDPFGGMDFGSYAAAGGARGGVYIAFKLPWRVSYNANGANSGTVPNAGPAAPGATFTVSANTGSLAKSGFTFAGWNTAADGSGTSYPAGTGAFTAAANVELFARWEVDVPTPAPDNGGGAGGGGAATEEPTPTPTPTSTAPVSSAPVPPALDPIGNQANPNIPAGGLPQGGSLLLVNGVPQPLTVAPDAQRSPTGLDIAGDGWKMKLVGRGDDGDPLGLTEKQALILQSGQLATRSLRAKAKVAPVAQASGDGFKAVSPVKFYLLDTSTYLGELITDGSGVFSGKIPVPAGIKPGGYTLQMNGYAPNDAVRSLSIGVVVKPTTVAVRSYRAATKVYFASLSPTLDAKAKAGLRALVKKTGKAGVRTAVVGYVQPTSVASNDQSLSTARAKNVATYLRSLGLKGAYAVRGDGKAQQSGATARRVNVTVTYTR